MRLKRQKTAHDDKFQRRRWIIDHRKQQLEEEDKSNVSMVLDQSPLCIGIRVMYSINNGPRVDTNRG